MLKSLRISGSGRDHSPSRTDRSRRLCQSGWTAIERGVARVSVVGRVVPPYLRVSRIEHELSGAVGVLGAVAQSRAAANPPVRSPGAPAVGASTTDPRRRRAPWQSAALTVLVLALAGFVLVILQQHGLMTGAGIVVGLGLTVVLLTLGTRRVAVA
jgi:hypothetical protein